MNIIKNESWAVEPCCGQYSPPWYRRAVKFHVLLSSSERPSVQL